MIRYFIFHAFLLVSCLFAVESGGFIENIIDGSLKSNPNILSKESALSAATSSESGAMWQYFPTPSMSAEQGKGGVATKSFKVQQPLWAGGRLDAEYNKAKSGTKTAQVSVEEAKQNVAVSIAQAVYNVLSAYGHVLVNKDAVERLENHKKMISRRVGTGVSPEADLLLVEARLVQAKTDYSMAQATQEKTLATLEQWAARRIDIKDLSPILPTAACKIALPAPYQNDKFIETVMSKHPSLLRFNEQIEAARYEVSVKKAALWPSVYASAERQLNSSNNPTNITANQTNFNVGLQYTPGAGLSASSAIESAQANLLGLESDKESTKLELKQKMIGEMSDYTFTRDRYDNYVVAVDATQRTTESYIRLFVAGKKSWLDVLNSEREWSTAQISLSDVQTYLATMPVRLRAYACELAWQKDK
jgi:outer membrane protein, adhesin transport system